MEKTIARKIKDLLKNKANNPTIFRRELALLAFYHVNETEKIEKNESSKILELFRNIFNESKPSSVNKELIKSRLENIVGEGRSLKIESALEEFNAVYDEISGFTFKEPVYYKEESQVSNTETEELKVEAPKKARGRKAKPQETPKAVVEESIKVGDYEEDQAGAEVEPTDEILFEDQ